MTRRRAARKWMPTMFGCAVALPALGWSMAQQARDLDVNELRAKRILLVGEGGKAVSVLDVTNGAATLSFVDRDGKVRLFLSGGDLGEPGAAAVRDAGLEVFDRSGASRLQATVSTDRKQWATLRVAVPKTPGAEDVPPADGSITADSASVTMRLRAADGSTVFQKP